jgi:putative endonuclease
MTLGARGEDIAEKYLKKRGYCIIERNFRCRLGEIDIIALDGTSLVFIEVKTRRNQNYGRPCEAVTTVKINHILRTAACYTSLSRTRYVDIRIDVIEILIQDQKTYLHHIKNITG